MGKSKFLLSLFIQYISLSACDNPSYLTESEDATKDSKTVEVAAELSEIQTDESLQHHRDSASTLGGPLVSSARSAASHTMELRSTSEEPAPHPREPVITTLTTQEDGDGEKEAVGKSFEVSLFFLGLPPAQMRALVENVHAQILYDPKCD